MSNLGPAFWTATPKLKTQSFVIHGKVENRKHLITTINYFVKCLHFIFFCNQSFFCRPHIVGPLTWVMSGPPFIPLVQTGLNRIKSHPHGLPQFRVVDHITFMIWPEFWLLSHHWWHCYPHSLPPHARKKQLINETRGKQAFLFNSFIQSIN